MKHRIALWLILAGLWALLSWHFTGLLPWFNVATATLVVFLAVRMGAVDEESLPLALVPRILFYLPWLVGEVFRSNVRVAALILSPKPRLNPRIVHFRGSQKTDLGRFLYANSITLTPGTVTTGVKGSSFEVHALRPQDIDGSEENEMNRRVAALEGASPR